MYTIIGLVRERNESLLLQDTLDHLSKHVDGIIVFDDASTDNSVRIAESHPSVIEVIKNTEWNMNQKVMEPRQRQALLEASKKYNPEWLFYVDADERFEGEIKQFLLSSESKDVNGVRICLLDAYMTPDDQEPYVSAQLYDFRKYFGPEAREILMIWRNRPEVSFEGDFAREPNVKNNIITKFYCQHYGKALSVEHWEQTCGYYSTYIPEYRDKWLERKGKSIHHLSDFGRPLYLWADVKKNMEIMYRYNSPSLITRFKKVLNKVKFST